MYTLIILKQGDMPMGSRNLRFHNERYTKAFLVYGTISWI